MEWCVAACCWKMRFYMYFSYIIQYYSMYVRTNIRIIHSFLILFFFVAAVAVVVTDIEKIASNKSFSIHNERKMFFGIYLSRSVRVFYTIFLQFLNVFRLCFSVLFIYLYIIFFISNKYTASLDIFRVWKRNAVKTAFYMPQTSQFQNNSLLGHICKCSSREYFFFQI